MNTLAWEIGGALALVIEIAAMWKVFVKAGQPGWAAIIPVFNLVVLFKIAGRSLSYLILLFVWMWMVPFILFLGLEESFFSVLSRLAIAVVILFFVPTVPYFMFLMLLGPAVAMLFTIPIVPIFTFLSLLAFPFAYPFLVPIAIAKRFGKGPGFGLGLAFLGFIFFPILAWGNVQYQTEFRGSHGASISNEVNSAR